MAKRIGLIALALVIVMAVVFTGCTPARRPYNNYGQYNGTGTNTGYNGTRTNTGYNGTRTNTGYNGTNYQTGTRFGNNMGTSDWANTQGGMYNSTGYNNTGYNNTRTGMTNTNNATTLKADTLARDCEQVNGVRKANVVVTGNTAYVGIDFDKNNGVANQGEIKKAVAERVRASGQNINTVYVSSEANFMNRLRGVSEGVRAGRPVEGFTTELRDMIQRITPVRW